MTWYLRSCACSRNPEENFHKISQNKKSLTRNILFKAFLRSAPSQHTPKNRLFPGRGRASMNFDGWIDQQNFHSFRSASCIVFPLLHPFKIPNRKHVEWFIILKIFQLRTNTVEAFSCSIFTLPKRRSFATRKKNNSTTAIVKWKVKSSSKKVFNHRPNLVQCVFCLLAFR